MISIKDSFEKIKNEFGFESTKKKNTKHNSNNIPKHVIFVVLFLGISIFVAQELLNDFLGTEVYLFLFVSTLLALILFVIMDKYFVPISELKDDLHELPNLNLDLVNNYDDDMDKMNSILAHINDQVRAEKDHLEHNKFIARTIDSLRKVKGLLSENRIDRALREVSEELQNDIEDRDSYVKHIGKTIDLLEPLRDDELQDNSEGLYNLKSSSDVETIEKNSEYVWGMSSNLSAETEDEHVKINVVQALTGKYKPEPGKEAIESIYCYIVPDIVEINNNIKKLKRFWLAEDVSHLQISRVRFIKIPSENWVQVHDIAIYNKNQTIEFIPITDKNSTETVVYREIKKNKRVLEAVEKEINEDRIQKKYGQNNEDFFNFQSKNFKLFLEEDFDQYVGSDGKAKILTMSGLEVEIDQKTRDNWIKKCVEQCN